MLFKMYWLVTILSMLYVMSTCSNSFDNNENNNLQLHHKRLLLQRVLDCETALAYDPARAKCFSQFPELGNNVRWGWTNGPYNSSLSYPITIPIYAGAANCDISKGELVGNLVINYDAATCKISLTYNALYDYFFTSLHVYVGTTPLFYKANGQPSVAFGQFPYVYNFNEYTPVTTFTINIEQSFCGSWYLIAHADACLLVPTSSPTSVPTALPTPAPTNVPTSSPTNPPTPAPTNSPTQPPTPAPTNSPTNSPTPAPTNIPTNSPTPAPTNSPTNSPTSAPTNSPTNPPTPAPTNVPTQNPTPAPTNAPTRSPTNPPTPAPTNVPTNNPTPAPTDAPVCETAYAFDDENYSKCFTDAAFGNFNNWGWSNGAYSGSSLILDIYAGAAQCDLTKGTLVGHLIVSYDNCQVTIKYEAIDGFTFSELQLYVGTEPLYRVNGHYTISPGQFPYKVVFGIDNAVSEYTFVINQCAPFYIVAHAVTC